MALALCLRRSASKLASSVCGGRVRSISTVVKRQSPLRPFVSRNYSTDYSRVSCDQKILQALDSEFNLPVCDPPHYEGDVLGCFYIRVLKDRATYVPGFTPVSFPYDADTLPWNRTATFTREYNGKPFKVVVAMPYSLLNESNDDDPPVRRRPIVVTLIRKSGRNLELICRASPDEIIIDDIIVSIESDCMGDHKGEAAFG